MLYLKLKPKFSFTVTKTFFVFYIIVKRIYWVCTGSVQPQWDFLVAERLLLVRQDIGVYSVLFIKTHT